jgi:uncharacterized membrane protein (UPF0127 family)
MKKSQFLLLSLVVIACGCGQGGQHPAPPAERPLQKAMTEGRNPLRSESIALGIGGATIEVEVAGDSDGTQLGLMFRKELAPDAGMWFEFPEEDYLRFWMRNTQVPLSIAYVDGQGVIANIEDMTPFDESQVRSRRKVRYALEMNRGWFEKKGIKAGDKVRIGRKRKGV